MFVCAIVQPFVGLRKVAPHILATLASDGATCCLAGWHHSRGAPRALSTGGAARRRTIARLAHLFDFIWSRQQHRLGRLLIESISSNRSAPHRQRSLPGRSGPPRRYSSSPSHTHTHSLNLERNRSLVLHLERWRRQLLGVPVAIRQVGASLRDISRPARAGPPD